MRPALTTAAVLLPAAILGLAGDLLFRQADAGVNLSLWIVGVAGAWVWLRRRAEGQLTRDERVLLGAVAGLSLALLWRDSEMLRLLNCAALLLCAALLPLAASRTDGSMVNRLALVDLVRAGIRFVARLCAGLMPGLAQAARDRQERAGGAPVAALVRGAFFAVPLLGIFGVLLASADAEFEAFLTGLVRVDLTPLRHHVLLVGIFSWLAAAMIGGAIRWPRIRLVDDLALPEFHLGEVELAMALGGMNLLFTVFVVFQLPHFFGGDAEVARQTGLTYATYARGGFFQLVVVSLLVLPILLLAEAGSRAGTPRTVRCFRALAAIQILLVFVIMASAMHRMALYQRQFGLTEDRLYASALIAGLAVTFVWFAVTILRGAGHRFPGGALVAWGAWLVLLNISNPDRIIVETTLARGAQGLEMDLHYLSRLSADAVPAILADPKALNDDLIQRLQRRPEFMPARHDWRAWHLARSRARRLLAPATHAPS